MNRDHVTKSFLGFQLVALILVLVGCGNDYEGLIMRPFDEATIASIPDTVQLDTNYLIIESSVNRDFMPICPADGNPMTARIRLKDINEEPLSFSVSEATLFVVVNNKMWVRELVFSGPYEYRPHQMSMSANEGPKWSPGSIVTIVVLFRDEEGLEYRIKEESVVISESS